MSDSRLDFDLPGETTQPGSVEPWALDASQMVHRYAPAIRGYLNALIKNPDDAEEASQDFLMKMIQKGMTPTLNLRGRFRDYLKVAVRNAAMSRLRRKKVHTNGGFSLAELPAPKAPPHADCELVAEWRRCVLDRVWRALDRHQQESSGSVYYTVLRFAADYPDEASEQLAARTADILGRPFRADNFRKQLSRARRKFAELLLSEVARTLEKPTSNDVEDELIELGLMEYVREYLPDDWRERTYWLHIG